MTGFLHDGKLYGHQKKEPATPARISGLKTFGRRARKAFSMTKEDNPFSDSQAKKLLQLLWRGGSFSYFWTIDSHAHEAKRTHWHSLPDFPDPPDHTGAEVYFNINPLSGAVGPSPSSFTRGKVSQVAAVNCLYADFDTGKGHDYPDKEAVLNHLDKIGVPRACARVSSGGGYHCYWFFEEPFVIETEQDLKKIDDMQKRWVKLVGGDKAAKDLARVLRVPGTLNHKYDPPREVILEEFIPERAAPWDDYRALINTATPRKKQKRAEKPATPQTPPKDTKTHALTPNPEKWLSAALGKATVGNRNQAGLDLAVQLRDDGLSIEEARQWITSYHTEVEQPLGQKYHISEAIASLESAYSRPAREPARDPNRPAFNPRVKHTKTAGKATTTKSAPAGLIKKPEDEPKNPLTERAAAGRLCNHTNRLQWVKQWGWMGWDGTRWERDASTLAIKETASIAKQYHTTGLSLDEVEHKEERKAYLRFAGRIDSRGGAENTLFFARGMLENKTETFDQRPFKLNLKNGTLDLETGELGGHEQSDFLTQLSDIEYDPGANAPRWEAFLQEVMNKDQEMIDFLQRAIGYSLTGATGEQVLFFMHGAGANGKGVFL